MIDYIVLLLFIVSVYYTIKYKFIQFKCFRKTKEVLVNKKSKSAYSTFMMSLANHIGVGNIIGVTTALIYGGAGSIFWMCIFAIFMSVFSLIENTLAVKYRVFIDGEYRGGSAYYIKNGLHKNSFSFLVALFLVITSCIIFQSLQVNAVSESLFISFHLDKMIIYILIVLFAVFFIFNGTKRIVKISEIIVPFMSIGYILIVLYAIIINIENIPNTIKLIFVEAFNFKSIFAGGLFIGIKRSLFSHEAGLGTVPTISAMSDVKKPIEQGFIQVLGVFVDTVVMCTLTGIMILSYNVDLNLYVGYDLIIYCFKMIFGELGVYLAAIIVGLFGLGTIVSQYYLGESNLIFITKQRSNKKVLFIYQCLFIVGITIGVFFSLNAIWDMIDYGMIVLGLINIFSLIKLEREFKNEIFSEKQ